MLQARATTVRSGEAAEDGVAEGLVVRGQEAQGVGLEEAEGGRGGQRQRRGNF